MTDDATLSDFASSSGSDDDSSLSERDGTSSATEAPGDATGTEGDGASTAGGTAETPLSTYAWGEYTCARCGTGTERVWRDDGALVCPACKSW